MTTAPALEHVWRLELPANTTLINANDRMHPVKRAPYIKVIRQAAWALARHHKIPALQRAHVFYVLHPDTKTRRRDPGNWSPSAKAAVDGLVDAGILPDDNEAHLLGPDPRIGAPIKGGRLILWITDLDQMAPTQLAALTPPGDPS
ncbi:hypothetical protein E6R18_32870 [Streptomyces sp. A1277]|uniref:hypothetical protein n=1 Tax=Streptomyces sp. A1277 TaxID=2563103 RepID=UPI0010A222D7|nr:hypothetical protein [Streptomyces sp. A1277]THA22741.1 hypothetical protein E6R18_32870 [Streptomyces sp. A1277]